MTQSTDKSAAEARGRGVLHASVAGTLFQGVYALSQFVILAVLLRYIGAERFGMWTTIWSIGIWALLANLGIQSALLTRLGQIATTDRASAGAVLGSALVLVSAVSGLLFVLTVVVAPRLPWSAILNVHSEQAVREAMSVAVAAILMVLLGLPAALGGAALLAVQRGRASYAALTVAHLGCAAAVAIGVWLGWPLMWLAVVVMSPPVVAGALQWVLLLRGPHAAALGGFSRGESAGLLRTGLGFFMLELMTIGLMQTGSVIIAQTHGAAAVTPYAAMYRLIGLVLAVYLALTFAYWPAFGDAAQRGDHHWFARALRWSLLKTVGVWAVSALGIYLLGDWFIGWWLGDEALPTAALKGWMIVFVGVHGLLLWLTTPLKGVGRLRGQLLSGVAMMAVFIPLAVWLCRRYGAAGVPMAQAAVIVLIGLPVNAVCLRRVMRDGKTKPT